MLDRSRWLSWGSFVLLSMSVGCALPHAAVRGSEDAAADVASDMGPRDTGADVIARDEGADSDSSMGDVLSEEPSIDGSDASEAGDASDERGDGAMLDGAIDGAIDGARDSATDAREAGVDAARDASDASDAATDAACPMGQSLCSSGCVDTRTNANHCGMCERACPTSPQGFATCESGFCALRCNPGYRYAELMGVP
ncbi:MAG: hypothetical protein U0269_33950, partial [Polyangiales bacterium]